MTMKVDGEGETPFPIYLFPPCYFVDSFHHLLEPRPTNMK
jgi:hypothetical protein